MPRQPAFASLVRGTTNELDSLIEEWRSGHIDADELGDELHAALSKGHADAYLLGARQAGSTMDAGALRSLADSHGRAAADAENEWLDKFLLDLENGRYDDGEGGVDVSAINRRSAMYGQKLRATSGRAFVDQSPAESTFTWTLGGAERHCPDCPRLAALSPYTAAELFTYPGGGDTACLSGCKCHLVRDDGVASFRRP